MYMFSRTMSNFIGFLLSPRNILTSTSVPGVPLSFSLTSAGILPFMFSPSMNAILSPGNNPDLWAGMFSYGSLIMT